MNPKIKQMIDHELMGARDPVSGFRNFDTYLGGLAVIQEEIGEFKREVEQKEQNREAMLKEAIQAAAMLIRFIEDCKLLGGDIEDHRYFQGKVMK